MALDARIGEWLAGPVRGRGLRLVIEEMNARAEDASIGAALLVTEPSLASPGGEACPAPGGAVLARRWMSPREVEFQSLRVETVSPSRWVRRYRVEVSADGGSWRTATPSRLVDSVHRQPFRIGYALEEFESSLVPGGGAGRLARHFHEDYLMRSVELLGAGTGYPSFLSSPFFIGCGARPYFFNGFFAPGDCPVFNSLIASIVAPELAVETERVYAEVIRKVGFLAGFNREVPGGAPGLVTDLSGINWPPSTFRDIFAWSQAWDQLPPMAEASEQYARWILDNRDRDRDGWLEPGVNGCAPSTAEFRARSAKDWPETAVRAPDYWDYVCLQHPQMSAFQAAIYELATDDYPVYVSGRHRGVRFDPRTGSLDVHYIDTQAYLACLAGFLDFAFRSQGRDAEAERWAAESRRASGLLTQCWDPVTRFFHDVDPSTGKPRSFVKHVGGFYPLMLGTATVNQAECVVDHLTNPREFWTDFPVPSMALDAQDFIPSGYWSGRSWPPFNFIVLRGLLNYGFFEVADELLRRWMAHTRSCIPRPAAVTDRIRFEGKVIYDARETRFEDIDLVVAENWNSRTGEVHGSGGTTWGGLWIPSLIMRNFWPVGRDGFLLRGGGYLRLRQGGRWNVEVEGDKAQVNGRSYRLQRNTTYRGDERTGEVTALEQGRADPLCI
jgi:hypothetical protein